MTAYDARTVWCALDGAAREEIDAAVAAGVPVPEAALAAVGVWRALRRRRDWRVALWLSSAAVTAAAFLVPARGTALLVALLGLPVWRLLLLRRGIDVNAGLAVRVPQRGTPPGRPATSELRRHLAARASRRV